MSLRTPSLNRVLSRYARFLSAKNQYLKAIDFTIGLIRRMGLMKVSFMVPETEIRTRLIEMRKAAQSGVDMSTLLENKSIIKGKGSDLLKKMEKLDAQIAVADADLADFVRTFSNKVEPAVQAQADSFRKDIASSLKVEEGTVEDSLIRDAVFFSEAFAVMLPTLKKVKAAADAHIGGLQEGGDIYESRVKEAKSSFGKQTREGRVPVIYFKDLVGCRLVASNVPRMAAIAKSIQSNFDILDKKNYYLQNKGYNAINYNLGTEQVVFEAQCKTSVNAMEAALSHDLIYAPEKAVLALSDQEKKMVAQVVEVSTQLSMREWSDAFGLALKTAGLR